MSDESPAIDRRTACDYYICPRLVADWQYKCPKCPSRFCSAHHLSAHRCGPHPADERSEYDRRLDDGFDLMRD